MDLGLKDKHVLITGGSKGIGFDCAQIFLEEGARVTLLSRSIDTLKEAQNKLNADNRIGIYSADLIARDQAQLAIENIEKITGPIDILVNSAGAAKRTPALELTEAAWHDAMDAKYFTYVHAMNAVLPLMAKRQSGVVVNVIGMGGKLAKPIHIAGGAANAALMLATAGLGQAYAPHGVRVVGVNPGLTLTERFKEGIAVDARSQGISEADAIERSKKSMAMGRIAEPREIADVVVYLASNRASYVSGATLGLDGATTSAI